MHHGWGGCVDSLRTQHIETGLRMDETRLLREITHIQHDLARIVRKTPSDFPDISVRWLYNDGWSEVTISPRERPDWRPIGLRSPPSIKVKSTYTFFHDHGISHSFFEYFLVGDVEKISISKLLSSARTFAMEKMVEKILEV